MAELYFNGQYIGDIDNPKDYIQHFKTERRSGKVNSKVNIFYNEDLNSVHVNTVRGRAQRPLIIVKDGTPLLNNNHVKAVQKGEMSWDDLVRQGVVEYLDPAEEENSLIAFTPEELTKQHTHLEIDPVVMLGLVTTLVPFGNFNPGPRLSIGGKHQKQAIGLYAANYGLRLDMDVNILHYPQAPIVKTMMHDIAAYNTHPAGQNIVIAVMCYDGYNMEDATVINKATIERGFGRSTYYRPVVAEELRYSGGLTDQISIPDKEVKGYKSEKDYRCLEEDGIISPEQAVKEDDVMIGKTSPPRFLSGMDEYSLVSNVRRESSMALHHGESGVVDFVLISENEEGNKLVQVRLREQRIPEIGDKLTSRHGQKGVIGLIVPASDMPFSATGIVPDLVFSPHGIPSRMTVSHLLETLGAKVGSLAGRYIDASTFSGEPEDKLRKELEHLGFRENGTETFYSGVTGKQYKAKIFVGNMYYLRLKHLVANKLQSRALGPIQLLTRQPTEGKAKEGGLRVGEMEKDTFVAHGASLLLKERFDSDKTVVPVCESCGIIAIKDSFKERKYCPICGENVKISDIEVSYAFKLMLDEFKALGIHPKLELENKY